MASYKITDKILQKLKSEELPEDVIKILCAIKDQKFINRTEFKEKLSLISKDDQKLREFYIDRIYDTYIDEEELQACDVTVKKIADYFKKNDLRDFQYLIQVVFASLHSADAKLAQHIGDAPQPASFIFIHHKGQSRRVYGSCGQGVVRLVSNKGKRDQSYPEPAVQEFLYKLPDF